MTINIIELLDQDGFSVRPKSPAGKEYCGPCPMCKGEDRFLVWPEEGEGGRFHCIRGCGWKGDAIQYLRDWRKLSFGEAEAIVRKHRSSGKVRNTETPRRNTCINNKISVSPSVSPKKRSETPNDKSNDNSKLGDSLGVKHSEAPAGLTLEQLAKAKRLSLDLLKECGVSETKCQGKYQVNFPYMNEAGGVVAVRRRHSLTQEPRFSWRTGDKASVHGLYGVWRLAEIRKAGWCLIVEGESDCITCWQYGIPAIGIAGKTLWRAVKGEYFHDIEVFLWVEPDAKELPGNLAPVLPGLKVIFAPGEYKDLNEAHCAGANVPELLEQLKKEATPVAVLVQAQKNARVAELQEQCKEVMEHADPLKLVEVAITDMGYGGDIRQAIIAYLAATSRLLPMRNGAMPVHLLLTGQASAGKSYALKMALSLLPESAYHEIPAGSPRALIYDESDLRHRAVIFSEADSLPTGEDNPAASAIRSLLQDHYLHYFVTVRNPETGEFIVKEIVKPGPTVLLTTSTRRLPNQLDTRVFTLEIGDHPGQIRAALKTQADLEVNGGGAGPDPGLVAFQELLQELVPIGVHVPFAAILADGIEVAAVKTRILRDYARIISLIKSVAVIRMFHRQRNERGEIIATPEDYATVYSLIGDLYRATVSGFSKGVSDVVRAVAKIGGQVSMVDIETHLGLSKATVSRRVNQALRNHWLINEEDKKNKPYKLTIGEPLPDESGLPAPELFHCFNGAKHCETASETPHPDDNTANQGERFTVSPVSGEHNEIVIEKNTPPLIELVNAPKSEYGGDFFRQLENGHEVPL